MEVCESRITPAKIRCSRCTLKSEWTIAAPTSRFEDFPGSPFGSPGNDHGALPDAPFQLLTPLTSDIALISSAVALLDRPLGFGGDNAESGAEALVI